MITLFIWLLTALLVITSLFLILLVLIQLPKKDAGAGLAEDRVGKCGPVRPGENRRPRAGDTCGVCSRSARPKPLQTLAATADTDSRSY